MSATAIYRKQHAELVELIQAIAGNLDESALANGAAADASEMLTKLAGKLLVHLAAEDYGLYPKMIESGDGEAVSTAKQYQDEMGGLKEAFTGYYAKWNGAEKSAPTPRASSRKPRVYSRRLASACRRKIRFCIPWSIASERADG